jgi:hypothetical protein
MANGQLIKDSEREGLTCILYGWSKKEGRKDITSRACALSPASRSNFRADGGAGTRLPDDAAGKEGATAVAAGAVTRVGLGAAGAGVGAAAGATTVYEANAATSLASSTVIIIGCPTFTSPVPTKIFVM